MWGKNNKIDWLVVASFASFQDGSQTLKPPIPEHATQKIFPWTWLAIPKWQVVGWIPHQQPHHHIPQWFTIWWFPKIGGTPLWMFYNGKSFQSGWFRGTPHFRKTDTGGITVWRRKEARIWASKPHGRAPASLKQYPGFQVKRCYKMDIHFDHLWPLVATNIWSTVLYPWSYGCKHPSVNHRI